MRYVANLSSLNKVGHIWNWLNNYLLKILAFAAVIQEKNTVAVLKLSLNMKLPSYG